MKSKVGIGALTGHEIDDFSCVCVALLLLALFLLLITLVLVCDDTRRIFTPECLVVDCSLPSVSRPVLDMTSSYSQSILT